MILPLGVLAFWLLRQARDASFRLPTCRYRDFDRLLQLKSNFTVAAVFVALTGFFFLPWGLALIVWVVGCAVYFSKDKSWGTPSSYPQIDEPPDETLDF